MVCSFFPECNCDYGIDRKKESNFCEIFWYICVFFLFWFSFFEYLLNIRLLKFRESFQSRFPRDQLQFYFYKNLFWCNYTWKNYDLKKKKNIKNSLRHQRYFIFVATDFQYFIIHCNNSFNLVSICV